MDQRTREVRQDIERTRAALTNKIETLGAHVRGSVEETKNRVKQSFDPRYQVQQHPWPMMGISFLTGYMLERFVSKRSASSRQNGRMQTYEGKVLAPEDTFFKQREEYFERLRGALTPLHSSQTLDSGVAPRQLEHTPGEPIQPHRESDSTHKQRRPAAGSQPDEAEVKPKHGVTENVFGQVKDYGRGMLDEMSNQLKRELDVLKGAAVGALASLVHDMVKQVAPAASSYAKQALDTASTKLTGRPLPTFREDTTTKEETTATPAEQHTEPAERRSNEALHQPI